MLETWVQSLGREDPLEEKMATHSSVLAWRIPCTEEPGGLQSIGSQRVGHNWVTNTFTLIFIFLNLLLPLEKTITLYWWVTYWKVCDSQVYSLMNFHTLNPPSTQIKKKKKNMTSTPTSLLTAVYNHLLHTGVATASGALTWWSSRRAATAGDPPWLVCSSLQCASVSACVCVCVCVCMLTPVPSCTDW